MQKFMLLMRGSQTEFVNMSAAEQRQIINDHIAWSYTLKEHNILLEGNGFSTQTTKLYLENGVLVTKAKPYTNTEDELSGYYLIQAETEEAALQYAMQCPALKHGESVEVIPLGH